MICGADGWTEIEEFGKSNEGWFRKFLKLDNGIPSHDTFARVFSLLSSGPSRSASGVEEAFIDADARNYEGVQSDQFETVERGHGRSETRRYWIPGELEGIDQQGQGKGLNVVGMVQSIRGQDGHTSSEYRYYIGSIGDDTQRLGKAVRGHWSVENELHWSLDVSFREDESRGREPQAAENFTVLRHIALARLKNGKTLKRGIKTKRLQAGWDEKYRAKLLFDLA